MKEKLSKCWSDGLTGSRHREILIPSAQKVAESPVASGVGTMVGKRNGPLGGGKPFRQGSGISSCP